MLLVAKMINLLVSESYTDFSDSDHRPAKKAGMRPSVWINRKPGGEEPLMVRQSPSFFTPSSQSQTSSHELALILFYPFHAY